MFITTAVVSKIAASIEDATAAAAVTLLQIKKEVFVQRLAGYTKFWNLGISERKVAGSLPKRIHEAEAF